MVANTLQFLGYEPVWQDIFGTEQGDLRALLRRQIDACAGVVQLVGFCYGFEPPTVEKSFGRVSYTQYEAFYAKQCGKPVWYLLLDEHFPMDAQSVEPEDLRELQTTYRRRIQTASDLYQTLSSHEALETSILKLRNDLDRLRRGVKLWAAGVVSLLLIILIIVVGSWRSMQKTKNGITVFNKQSAVSEARKSLERAVAARDLTDHGQVAAIESLIAAGQHFARADLSGITLTGARFPGVDLNNARFVGTDLSGVNGTGADLSEANLKFSTLTSAVFDGSNLADAYAVFSTASNLHAHKANCARANFFGATLSGADFSGTDLRGASFAFCGLRNADLTGASLEGAFFIGSLLDGAKLTGAHFKNTDFTGALFTPSSLSPSEKEQICRTGSQNEFLELNVTLIDEIPSSRFAGGIEHFRLFDEQFNMGFNDA